MIRKGHLPIMGLIARLQILAEIVPAGLDNLPQMLQARLLLIHAVAAVVDDDIEAVPRLFDEAVEEGDVGLVAGEHCRARRLVRPLRGARGVVLDIVQIDVGEVFQPGVIARARAVVHVAAEADLEHFKGSGAERGEVFGVHVLVAVGGYFVGAVLGGDFVEGGEGMTDSEPFSRR